MKVLFACVHNAGRSQMAAAFFNRLSEGTKDYAMSAGTEPAKCVHPEAVAVMQEIGIDLRNVKPQLLTNELAGKSDLLITMGCGESCPYVPGLRREDWPLSDPAGKSIDEVRKIRDEIKGMVQRLISN